jgi:hypothetical protein
VRRHDVLKFQEFELYRAFRRDRTSLHPRVACRQRVRQQVIATGHISRNRHAGAHTPVDGQIGFLTDCIRGTFGLSFVMEQIMTRKAFGRHSRRAVCGGRYRASSLRNVRSAEGAPRAGHGEAIRIRQPHAWLHVASRMLSRYKLGSQ